MLLSCLPATCCVVQLAVTLPSFFRLLSCTHVFAPAVGFLFQIPLLLVSGVAVPGTRESLVASHSLLLMSSFTFCLTSRICLFVLLPWFG